MKVRIYKPSKTAMQSGVANTKHWLVEPLKEEDSRFIDPVMGWVGSSDMKQQLRLKFKTKEEAVAFAKKSGYEFDVIEPKARKMSFKSYADNFKS